MHHLVISVVFFRFPQSTFSSVLNGENRILVKEVRPNVQILIKEIKPKVQTSKFLYPSDSPF